MVRYWQNHTTWALYACPLARLYNCHILPERRHPVKLAGRLWRVWETDPECQS